MHVETSAPLLALQSHWILLGARQLGYKFPQMPIRQACFEHAQYMHNMSQHRVAETVSVALPQSLYNSYLLAAPYQSPLSRARSGCCSTRANPLTLEYFLVRALPLYSIFLSACIGENCPAWDCRIRKTVETSHHS